jgi:hypothetical protein
LSYCFILAKIFKSWLNSSFVLFICKALKHKKVRSMRGAGGESDKMRDKMLETKKTYKQLQITVQECGINAFVFDSKLLVHKHQLLVITEDKQVNTLLRSKLAFSAWVVVHDGICFAWVQCNPYSTEETG